jgi:hypothetical protein
MESSGTPENLEDDLRGQISSPWCVLYINGKFLKHRCPKWPRIAHLDIYSPSYGKKKGRESNCQFDSRPLKFRNRPLPDVTSRSATWRWKALDESYNFGLDRSEFGAKSYDRPKSRDSNPRQFRVPTWESREKEPFGCSLGRELQSILYGGRWWLPPSPGHGESSV